jgi:hypothetical protein
MLDRIVAENGTAPAPRFETASGDGYLTATTTAEAGTHAGVVQLL